MPGNSQQLTIEIKVKSSTVDNNTSELHTLETDISLHEYVHS